MADSPYDLDFFSKITDINFDTLYVLVLGTASSGFSASGVVPNSSCTAQLTDASGQGTFNFSVDNVRGYAGPSARNIQAPLTYTVQAGDPQIPQRFKAIGFTRPPPINPAFDNSGSGKAGSLFPMPPDLLKMTVGARGEDLSKTGGTNAIGNGSVTIQLLQFYSYKSGDLLFSGGEMVLAAKKVFATAGARTDAKIGKVSATGTFVLDPKTRRIIAG